MSVNTTDMQSNHSHDIAAVLRAAERNHTKPLWLQMNKLNPPLPNPKSQPHVWKYSEIRPSLIQAGSLVGEQQAERRVLMLVNPSRGAVILARPAPLQRHDKQGANR